MNEEFLSELSNFDLIEAAYLARAAASEGMAMFMTTLFAYLVTIYFVGEKLTRMQIASVTVIYSLFAFYCAIGVYGATRDVAILAEQVRNADVSFLAALSPAFVLLGWALSLAFLWQTRRRRVDSEVG